MCVCVCVRVVRDRERNREGDNQKHTQREREREETRDERREDDINVTKAPLTEVVLAIIDQPIRFVDKEKPEQKGE